METTGLEFGDIYREYHKKLLRYLERMVGKNDAEDLTQEVFVKINGGLSNFQGKSSVSTWVYRIATNAALDKLKSRSFRESRETIALAEMAQGPESRNMEKGNLSSEREAIRKEMNECIREFVDKLPTDYRIVILLSEMKDLKNQEMADILGISLDAVKIRLHRARARLKAEFEAGCDFYQDEDGNMACDRKGKNDTEIGVSPAKALSSKGKKGDTMDKKTEEMVALGVAYGINCVACMEYHKKEAIKAGLTEEEMLAAITVAKQVKAGATKKTESLAQELFGQAGDGPCCPPGTECCP